MPTEDITEPWTIRSTLIAVSDLDRSVDFYQELGPFDEIVREDAVAVLGDVSPASIALILREMRSTTTLAMANSRWVCGRSTSRSDRSASWIGSSPYCDGRELFTSRREIADGDVGNPTGQRSRTTCLWCSSAMTRTGHVGPTITSDCQPGLFTGRLRPPSESKRC